MLFYGYGIDSIIVFLTLCKLHIDPVCTYKSMLTSLLWYCEYEYRNRLWFLIRLASELGLRSVLDARDLGHAKFDIWVVN